MDFKLLADALRSRGLDVAEEGAKAMLEETLDWLSAEVLKTENTWDDMLVAIIPLLKPALMKAVDKIDGEVG